MAQHTSEVFNHLSTNAQEEASNPLTKSELRKKLNLSYPLAADTNQPIGTAYLLAASNQNRSGPAHFVWVPRSRDHTGNTTSDNSAVVLTRLASLKMPLPQQINQPDSDNPQEQEAYASTQPSEPDHVQQTVTLPSPGSSDSSQETIFNTDEASETDEETDTASEDSQQNVRWVWLERLRIHFTIRGMVRMVRMVNWESVIENPILFLTAYFILFCALNILMHLFGINNFNEEYTTIAGKRTRYNYKPIFGH